MKHRYFIHALFCLLVAVLPGLATPQTAFATPPEITSGSHVNAGLRGFAEAGMGTVFGAVAGGGALFTGLLVSAKRHKTDLTGTFAAAAILYPAGVASGAILGGYLGGSRSGYWEPFVGAFTGAAIADITAYFLSEDYPVLCAVLVIVLPIVTTTIAMETSHAWHKPRKTTPATPLMLHFSF